MTDKANNPSDERPVLSDEFLKACDEAQLRALVESCSQTMSHAHQHETMRVTAYLVVHLISHNKNTEALPLARCVHMFYERIDGEESGTTQRSLKILAGCLQTLWQYEEAERLFIKCLDITQRTQGHEHSETILCCSHLASCWEQMGKRDEAEGLHCRALDLNTRLFGPDQVQTIDSTAMLGAFLVRRTDKAEEGAQLLHTALDLNIRTRGLRHESTILCMHSLSRALVKTGDYIQAERFRRCVLDLSTTINGPEHVVTLNSVQDLCDLLMKLERFEEALPWCQKDLELRQRLFGDEHHSTLQSMNQLAIALMKTGGLAEAGAMASRVVSRGSHILGPEHPITMTAASLVRVLSRGSRGRASR